LGEYDASEDLFRLDRLIASELCVATKHEDGCCAATSMNLDHSMHEGAPAVMVEEDITALDR
jgi:hypothetical protein